MRIYRMTATFGKLEHQTLELQPGLNIIHAPNEWGKSTWCAFLLAMFYGLDTRARTTKNELADKERYAPWSGSPMSGRVDLCWNGRDITLERVTKGRIPLGEFRAYETKTGILLPELTAANCGQMLLGVEQSVYRRSAFIRQSDLPVTADEAFRHRLNALVTTGDESGDGEKLEKGLKELKNRCRYNRTGLIPQAEAEKAAVEEKLRELESLETQSKKLKSRLGEAKSWARELENHRDALLFAAAEADAARVAQARENWETAENQLLQQENLCARLPGEEEIQEKIRKIREFQRNWEAARIEAESLPESPEMPQLPTPFAGMPLPHAWEMLGEDVSRYRLLTQTKPYMVALILAGAVLILGILAAFAQEWIIAAVLDLVGLVCLFLGVRKKRRWEGEIAALIEKYGDENPDSWQLPLEAYGQALEKYRESRRKYGGFQAEFAEKKIQLEKQRRSLCGEQNPEAVLEIWQNMLEKRRYCQTLYREAQQAGEYYRTLSAMIRPVQPPRMPDTLTYSAEETEKLLSEVTQEQQRLLSRLGQYRGRMEALGEEEKLLRQLRNLEEQIEKWENVYAAAQVGLDTLTQAKLELQRRFAPRIARRAQELMCAMTAGRYKRLVLGEDLRIRSEAGEEDTLTDALWRSDGTVDQLYLALRLAVAEELIPHAPLVLDDAFVRFDDNRLAATMKILGETAREKQIILFSCQMREKNVI